MSARFKLINWLLFAALALIWGSSFVLMKTGLKALTAYQVAALRMLSGGLVLLPLAARAIRTVPANKRGIVIISGFLGSFFPAFLFCIAETRIDSALAGMLNALTPLFTIAIGALFFQLQISLLKVLGVLTGFVGLCLLFIARGEVDVSSLGYASLVVLATVCYALNVNLVAKHLTGIRAVHIAAFAFACLIPPSTYVLWKTGYFSAIEYRDTTWLAATGAACVLGAIGTALASIIFYLLVKRAGTLFASLVTYGIPFVAIAWGLLYGELVSLAELACLLLILSGVYLVNKQSPTKQP